MRILFFLVIISLLSKACTINQIHSNYGDSSLDESWELGFDVRSSTFQKKSYNWGKIDTIVGYYHRKRNILKLNPHFANVIKENYINKSDSLILKFVGKDTDIPFSEATIILNGIEEVLNENGELLFSNFKEDNKIFNVSGPFLTPGTFQISKEKNVKYVIELMPESINAAKSFIYRIKKDVLKSRYSKPLLYRLSLE